MDATERGSSLAPSAGDACVAAGALAPARRLKCHFFPPNWHLSFEPYWGLEAMLGGSAEGVSPWQEGWPGHFKEYRRRPSARPRPELAGSAFLLLFQLLQLPE